MDVRINYPQEYLREEVNCGYTVTEDIKKVRIVQLDLLLELKRVCKKYGLTYFADSGTLIGAVRHKGYIPWDDDIDIVMKRADYNKLIEVAPEEFKEPYFLQTTYNDVDYIRGHAQLRNSSTTGYALKEEGKPYNRGIFIDIFPLDNLADDSRRLRKQKRKSKYLFTLMELGVNCRYVDKSNYKRYIAAHIMHAFFRIYDYKKMYRRFEKACTRYNDRPTEYLSYVSFSFGDVKHRWKAEWFDQSHEVPFEFTTINIPDGYDGRLRQEYGDYMEIRHAPTEHGELVLDAEIPYKEYKSGK